MAEDTHFSVFYKLESNILKSFSQFHFQSVFQVIEDNRNQLCSQYFTNYLTVTRSEKDLSFRIGVEFKSRGDYGLKLNTGHVAVHNLNQFSHLWRTGLKEQTHLFRTQQGCSTKQYSKMSCFSSLSLR